MLFNCHFQAAVIHLVWNPGNRHLYNLPGPLPLPFVGNALILAIPPEEVIPVRVLIVNLIFFITILISNTVILMFFVRRSEGSLVNTDPL